MAVPVEPRYPSPLVPAGHTEPVPRRIRAELEGRTVLDTLNALYVWETPKYPQYLIPTGDVDPAVAASAEPSPVSGYVRLRWDALDAWYEEDEEVFGHPRSPYARVDALRSSRRVRIELDGVVLAESGAPVMVFETGLPTRCYLDRSTVDFTLLRPTDSVTTCPYKGRTSAWWSVLTPAGEYPDLAWSYGFPTAALLPIAGLVAFYDEQVDVFLDGVRQARPVTHFSR